LKTTEQQMRNKMLYSYMDIIDQLTESLDCEADEIVDIVNVLNMTEYWVENKMLKHCKNIALDTQSQLDSLEKRAMLGVDREAVSYRRGQVHTANEILEILGKDIKEFIQKYKSQSLSLNELYDGSKR